MAKKLYTLTEEDGVVRIDKFMANKFPEYSRSALAKLFLLKLIKHDGEPYKAGEKVRPGTEIEYNLAPLQAVPEVVDLPIVYEDENIVVVDKPVGIISHARGRFWQEASVASFIRDYVVKQAEKNSKEFFPNETDDTSTDKDQDNSIKALRAGIVHRLDRATSGVMACAKNPETLSFLQKQFSAREVSKTYTAVIAGKPKIDEAIIDAPIARNPNAPRKFMVSKDGKASQTKYTVTKQDDHFTTLSLQPKTGRTHQLRVHLEYLGLPIVGDELYDGKEYSRLMLHAHELTLKLPNGKMKTFKAELPKEFSEIYNK